ncbi:ABC transporter ATP-binding protein [Radiobacillus kanasensis]|uniref:ABC transporter ATP-binding protein n=1 Tax=Radiobacillus kanasensis TaxID=2844358 RepID=UPI001E6111A6|nr:ABC transporter ATP-binding protein [Radiobacillus kanasensis]UFU00150.1 ABC transporter ATP-binding protein [Radiobacillus kanasensis]
MAILSTSNLVKIYGSKNGIQHKAIDHFSLNLEQGEFVGIMGPSGSGKTTLLNLLSTIDKPSSGQIQINGQDVGGLKRNKLAKFRRKEMGFVFQDFNLLDTLTIGENIMLPLTLNGDSVRDMENRLVQVVKRLNIDTIIHKRIYEVSGGQLQRAAIARAIIHDPAIIFADEPTGNLDSKASLQVMDTFQSLHRDQQTTTLMVTHDPFAASFCQRVVFIKDGKLYNEIYRGDNRQSFFQDILNVQSLLGGDQHDFSSIRF